MLEGKYYNKEVTGESDVGKVWIYDNIFFQVEQIFSLFYFLNNRLGVGVRSELV